MSTSFTAFFSSGRATTTSRRRESSQIAALFFVCCVSLLLVAAVPAVAGATAAPGESASPLEGPGDDSAEVRAWELLRDLRLALRSASPLQARFSQTFLPAGFDEGETEDGTLAVSLPECMRWDYEGDFAKSFLLCDDWAHSWNPGEPKGRRTRVDDELALEAPGLDFFLLDLDLLRKRYDARIADGDPSAGSDSPGASHHLELTPREPTPEVTVLEVTLAPDARTVERLSYVDAEGNRTTFELSRYERGAPPGTFAPPAEMQWEDS